MRTQKHKFLVEWEEKVITFCQKNFITDESERTVELGSCRNMIRGQTPVIAVSEDEAVTLWEKTFPNARIVNVL